MPEITEADSKKAEEIGHSNCHLFAITGGGYYPSFHTLINEIAKSIAQAREEGRLEMKEKAAVLVEKI
jgi:hypothetical protein